MRSVVNGSCSIDARSAFGQGVHVAEVDVVLPGVERFPRNLIKGVRAAFFRTAVVRILTAFFVF